MQFLGVPKAQIWGSSNTTKFGLLLQTTFMQDHKILWEYVRPNLTFVINRLLFK